MILCVAYYAPYFEWFGGAVSLSQWWDISHQFRHWMVFYISWCHLPKMGERTKQPVRSLHHIFHPKTQWQSPNPAQDPGEVLALGNTCSPCFSLLLSPEPWREKKTDAREKQGKDILPSLPAGTFPRSERLGQLEFARTFFHLSTKPHHKMLQFLFFVCLLVCSTFFSGKLFWRLELVILIAVLHPDLVDEAFLLFFWGRQEQKFVEDSCAKGAVLSERL